MKKIVSIAIIGMFALAPLSIAQSDTPLFAEMSASETNAPAASLTLKVENINRLKGDIVIGLFDSEENYKADTSVHNTVLPVTDYTLTTTFDGLSSGTYAIKLFHDKDSDGKLDKNIFGAPSERYAFSNEARDPFSQPEWEETVFEIKPGENTFSVAFKDKGRKSVAEK